MPSKRAAKSKGKSTKAAKTSVPKSGAGTANLECAECFGKFSTNIALANFAQQVGRKFNCPSCGALYEIISLQESRITVTILAKGETRTYGKTYDIATKDYARPL